MKQETISKASDRDEAPKLDQSFFRHARKMDGERVVREATRTVRGRPVKPAAERKQAVSIRLSPDVLEHFRGSGPGWQTRVDEALRQAMRKERKRA